MIQSFYCSHEWEAVPFYPSSAAVGVGTLIPQPTHRCKRCGKNGYASITIRAEGDFTWYPQSNAAAG